MYDNIPLLISFLEKFTNISRVLKMLLLLLFLIGCKQKVAKETKEASQKEERIRTEKEHTEFDKINSDTTTLTPLHTLSDTTFVRIADYSDGFAYDMRYATTNNFLKTKVYDCAECYTRVKTLKALLAANEDFKKSGVKIKFFDCYRPNAVQYKMWKIVPNPQYVANPVKGSIHNKGGAVDITLVRLTGEELDMGTDFDFFGKRAYHDNQNLPQEILAHRSLLKTTMEKFGFWSIRTEWWHYNLKGASKDPIANFTWECP